MYFARLIQAVILFSSVHASYSQDLSTAGADNYSGLPQTMANPAAAADNRLKLDIIACGAELNFSNTLFGIRREKLRNTKETSERTLWQLPSSWQNSTPNVPDNIFKNFSPVPASGDRSLLLNARILLPSALYQLDAKNAVGLSWSLRQMLNVDGISQPLVNLLENEFDLNVTQNNRITNKSLSLVQMSWAEYGFTYARVMRDKDKHFLKAGITAKLLQGLEGMYVIIDNLDFLFSTKDTLSYFDARVAYARSPNFRSPTRNERPVAGFYHHVTKVRPGLDLGLVYEWRPAYRSFRYRPDGKTYAWRKDLNKYKLKLSAALVDIGKIKFPKQGVFYNLDLAVRNEDFRNLTTVTDLEMLDSLLRADFSNQAPVNEFSIVMPTAINTQIDIALNHDIYLNLAGRISKLYKTAYQVHDLSTFCFAPRLEKRWWSVAIPFSSDVHAIKRSRKLNTGLHLRAGPLMFGSGNLIPLFKGDVEALHLYALLKIPVPYPRITDEDNDGVKDRDDDCMDEPGSISAKGCPDKDKDGVADKDDACPSQHGTAALRGCPDRDGDGVADKEDACPDLKGLKEMQGCPDSDGDGVTDVDDLCPAKKGPKSYSGCPDTDNDKVHDGADACVSTAGPVENKGCPWPDSDGDGIADRADSCRHIRGSKAFRGCPEPVKLAAVEKRTLEQAYTSLEFESGRDVIRSASYPSLNALADLMLSHRDNWQIRISGHTDSEGSEEGNLILSEKRAKAVANYLISRGVPPGNIHAEWFGQSRQVADNMTSEGKRKNRRVEITILMRNE